MKWIDKALSFWAKRVNEVPFSPHKDVQDVEVHFHHPIPAKQKGQLIPERGRVFEIKLNYLESDQSHILR